MDIIPDGSALDSCRKNMSEAYKQIRLISRTGLYVSGSGRTLRNVSGRIRAQNAELVGSNFVFTNAN